MGFLGARMMSGLNGRSAAPGWRGQAHGSDRAAWIMISPIRQLARTYSAYVNFAAAIVRSSAYCYHGHTTPATTARTVLMRLYLCPALPVFQDDLSDVKSTRKLSMGHLETAGCTACCWEFPPVKLPRLLPFPLQA